MAHPEPDPIRPGQESVWDYPRPPALEPVDGELTVEHAGRLIARTTRGYRVLETSHPPVYYFPPEACDERYVNASTSKSSSFCEWKGSAEYVDVVVDGERFDRVGWRYDEPTPRFEAIAGYVAFYAGPFDRCTVRGQKVTPQPGGFYGGWITEEVVGPFKGVAGSWGW